MKNVYVAWEGPYALLVYYLYWTGWHLLPHRHHPCEKAVATSLFLTHEAVGTGFSWQEGSSCRDCYLLSPGAFLVRSGQPTEGEMKWNHEGLLGLLARE